MTRAVAVAVAMTFSTESRSDASRKAMSPTRWTTRPVPIKRPGRTGRKAHVDVEGRLELVGFERGEQRRSNGVVEHRCGERPEHVAARAGEILGRVEGELDGAAVDVGVDRRKPRVAAAPEQRPPPFHRIPERSRTRAHCFSFAALRSRVRLPSAERTGSRRVLNGIDPRRLQHCGLRRRAGTAESSTCRV
jgi:hypothetical protein